MLLPLMLLPWKKGPIDSEVLHWIERAPWAPNNGSGSRETEKLMLRAFRHQADAVPAYAAYIRHLSVDPARVKDWREIPPVPASAFKSHDLSSAPSPSDAPGAVTFETSGTSISQPGRVRLSSTRLYETSAAP